MEYIIAIGVSVHLPTTIGICFYRQRPDFGEPDRDRLDAIHPDVSQAYQNLRNLQSLTQKEHDLAVSAQELEEAGRYVIALTPNSDARDLAQPVRQLMQEFFDVPLWQADRLPDELRQWCKRHQRPSSQDGDMLPRREPWVMPGEGKRLIIRFIDDHSGNQHLVIEEQLIASPVRLTSLGLHKELSFREAQVSFLMIQGLTNPQIAQEIGITSDTVRQHSSHIFDKLGVSSRTEAAIKIQGLLGSPVKFTPRPGYFRQKGGKGI